MVVNQTLVHFLNRGKWALTVLNDIGVPIMLVAGEPH
jgi:hypothetical protein